MQVVCVNLKRSHYGATVEEVCKVFNVGNGMSTLVGMAVDAEHRPTIEEYRRIVDWKIEASEGEPLARWRAVAAHIDVVLAGSQARHDYNAKQLALRDARATAGPAPTARRSA